MSDVPKGRFVWYELMTTDPGGAAEFYSGLTGWGTEEWTGPAEGMPPYKMFTNNEKSFGGLMELPEEARAQGAPPHWIAYIAVDDVDGTVERAKELGGKVYMGPMDMPEVGRMAVMADPSGAVFAAYRPAGEAPGHEGPAEVGEFSWHELMANDYSEALAFYRELFGWDEGDAVDMGEAGIYQMFNRAGAPLGGIMNRPPEMPVGAWNFYIRVADLDAATEKVAATGGAVVHGPMEVPGGDRVAVCQDPQGAMFSLHCVTAEA